MRVCPRCKTTIPPGRWEKCPACRSALPAVTRKGRQKKRSSIAPQILGIGSVVAALACAAATVACAALWLKGSSFQAQSLLSIALGILAVVLGASGIWICQKRANLSVGYASAGCTIGGLSLAIALGVYIGKHHVASSMNATYQTPVPLQYAKADAIADGEWPDASTFAVKQGDIQVRVQKLEPRGNEDFTVYLEVSNVGDSRDIGFLSWGAVYEPRIYDNVGRALDVARVAGGHVKTLGPGGRFSQTLSFSRLAKNTEFLHLELPASAFGGSGYLRLEIPNTMVVLQLTRCLGDRAMPGVCKLLRDGDPRIRSQACKALVDLSGETIDGAVALGVALSDGDRAVRLAACESLEKLGPWGRFASPLLSKAVQDTAPGVQEAAAKALAVTGEITASDVPILRSGLKSPIEDVRLFAIEMTAHFAAFDKEQASFIEALSDESKAVRVRAATILAQNALSVTLKHDALVGLLEHFFKSGDEELCVAAIQFLRSAGPMPETEIPVLRQYLACDAPEARRYAVMAIQRTPSLDALPDLVKGLEDRDPEVRAGAAGALGALGPDGTPAVQPLTKLAQTDPSQSVCDAANAALKAINAKRAPGR
jgi:HEAT repeat protein